MEETVTAAIAERLIALIVDMTPDANLRSMYGGTVIELIADTPQSRIGGVYAYAGHVSLEFAKGAQFKDPNNLLEGSGKARRHIKLYCQDDIETKTCKCFLAQAITLSQ